jgi:hypothetical protein
MWQGSFRLTAQGNIMSKISQARLLRERAIGPDDMPSSPGSRSTRARPARSVTVNLAESPLGWLYSRGLVTRLQFDAGERLRTDWERSQLPPKVTMSWDAAPIARGRGGSSPGADLSACHIDARRRFEAAVASAGPGLSDILWRIVCAGEGMREAETALGWPARAGKLVLCLALDRLAIYYRMG